MIRQLAADISAGRTPMWAVAVAVIVGGAVFVGFLIGGVAGFITAQAREEQEYERKQRIEALCLAGNRNACAIYSKDFAL